jgi:hypothetical protein
MCRRAHGAAFVTWVGVARSAFRLLSGEPVRYRSSEAATRSFCGKCGSTLFFESTRWADEVHLSLANVFGAVDRAPQAHVFFSDRVPWLAPPNDGLPRKGGTSGTELLPPHA